MKKAFLSIFLSLAVSTALGCWMNLNWINPNLMGVNNFSQHVYTNVWPGSQAFNYQYEPYVRNGMNTSLPITVWCMIDPKNPSDFYSRADYVPVNVYLTRLYYKIIPANATDDNNVSVWRLAKEIDFSEGNGLTVNLYKNFKMFGDNCLTKDKILKNGDTISKGDKIILVWYLVIGYQGTIVENAAPLVVGSNLPAFVVNDNDEYLTHYGGDGNTGYAAFYVMKVTYNGMKTPGR